MKEANFGTAYMITSEELLKNEITIFEDFIKIDVFTKLAGLEFNKVWKRKLVTKIEDQNVNFIHIKDLIKTEKLSKRKKDLEDALLLEKLI